MFKLTRLVTLAQGADEAAREALLTRLRAVTGAALVEPTLPGVYNGGDLIAHFQFAEVEGQQEAEAAIADVLASPVVAHVDGAAYAGRAGGVAVPGLAGGVYRTLLFSIDHPVAPEVVARFEAEMRKMPHYIPAIRNWQLSRVTEATGARRWTHVWEQEYESLDGLMGPYMLHPYHWARIDRWFDPECTEWMIDTHLCHTFCGLGRSVLTA